MKTNVAVGGWAGGDENREKEARCLALLLPLLVWDLTCSVKETGDINSAYLQVRVGLGTQIVNCYSLPRGGWWFVKRVIFLNDREEQQPAPSAGDKVFVTMWSVRWQRNDNNNSHFAVDHNHSASIINALRNFGFFSIFFFRFPPKQVLVWWRKDRTEAPSGTVNIIPFWDELAWLMGLA